MRVLVTGGSGFIGSHLVDKLRDVGNEVCVYDLVPPVSRQDVEFCQGSILDLGSLCSALQHVDAVMHLAAVADVKEVLADPHYAESINVRGTINVLEAMRRTDTKRVIYSSTVWVYAGADATIVDEDTPLQPPTHLYTATKLAGEYYCRAYANMFGLNSTVLRYGIPYGPGARLGAVVPTLVGKALSGEALTIAGDGSQFRQFVYVEDLAAGTVSALSPDATNRTYNLDGLEPVTIRQIADEIQQIVGPLPITFVPQRPSDFSGKHVSSRRAEAELKWTPRMTFAEGLRRYVAWARNTTETPISTEHAAKRILPCRARS